jgi:ABC-2 type transport system ATP-binding protein
VALEGLSLRVPTNSVYVLIGPNGAGKSTTFRLLMNLERPDAGTTLVCGLSTAERAADIRAQIGYVPEHQTHGYPWLTGSRWLRHVAAFYPSWDAAYADHLSSAFELRLDRKVGTLSKGESRRLQLVAALAHRPPLLLLDEPTDGLDPVARKRLLVLLTEHLADAPTTILISTHQIYEMESLADHIGVLRGGKLVAQMPRDELQRTVRRYRVALPEGWAAPPGLQLLDLRRSSGGREMQCTLIGEERTVTERLTATGALVNDVTSLTLEDAAVTFLSEEVTQ